jgi:hypothetical protein
MKHYLHVIVELLVIMGLVTQVNIVKMLNRIIVIKMVTMMVINNMRTDKCFVQMVVPAKIKIIHILDVIVLVHTCKFCLFVIQAFDRMKQVSLTFLFLLY